MAVWDVSSWEVAETEALGRERKIWLHRPGPDRDSREAWWLFKPVVVPANGHRQGEDWAEKVAADLGHALGIDCAQVELASRNGIEGSISRNVAPDGWNLVLGEVLLTTPEGSYVGGRSAPPGRPGHSPGAIGDALLGVEAAGTSEIGAFGMFCGYLLFDAWIANQDRHDQNWGVLRRATPPEQRVLAPSFDHASGLGFNLTDDARVRIQRDGLPKWARRGLAHRFEHDPSAPRASRPTLVDAAHAALMLALPDARTYWLDRLAALPAREVAEAVQRTPRMSDVAATFVLELLDTNRRRLLT